MISIRFPAVFFLLMTMAVSASPAEQRVEKEGVVARVQHVQVSGLEDAGFLILELESGASYQLLNSRRLAAGAGVKVAVESLPIQSPGDLPVACRVRVLGVPMMVDGEEVLRAAENPFEVYRDEDCQGSAARSGTAPAH